MANAVNDVYFSNSWLLAEAEGYQFDRASNALRMIPDPNPDPAKRNPLGLYDRTGGLVYRRRVELGAGDRLYRLGAKKYKGTGPDALVSLLNSPWWLDRERLYLLGWRAREAARPLSEMSRDQLALPVEWTDADIIVSVALRPGITIAAFAGPGTTAQAGTDRRVIAPEAPHLRLDQLYIPGLGRHPEIARISGRANSGEANVAAWFDVAGASSFEPPEKAIQG